MNSEWIDFAILREKFELSQTELAEMAGVSQATISRIESGDSAPNIKILSSIAKNLGVPVRELVPEDQLQALVGQSEQSSFAAFCPNPFCERNTYFLKDGRAFIKWSSVKTYPVTSFDEINYCTRCSTGLAKQCPNCGRMLDSGAQKFCISCGKQVNSRPTKEEWAEIRNRLDKKAVDSDEELPF